jgi:hypothetical protein
MCGALLMLFVTLVTTPAPVAAQAVSPEAEANATHAELLKKYNELRVELTKAKAAQQTNLDEVYQLKNKVVDLSREVEGLGVTSRAQYGPALDVYLQNSRQGGQ